MAELTVVDYKRFRDGIETQYNNLLAEKKTKLENMESDN